MKYRVIVTREASRWLGEIPSLEGVRASASSLDELAANLRELARGLVDDTVINLELVTPPPRPDRR